MRKKVNWVLDADIRDFFDSLDHGWLMKFLEHRIADRRVLRLIQKWLAAGVIEDGAWSETERGTPQGASVSPLLANVYLHYVFDLWAHQWRRRHARGDVIIVRYADDFVVGFQHRDDAERFLAELRDRLAKFGLELHPEKTRLIEFGRFAAQRPARRAGWASRRRSTSSGFTHICAKTRNGRFMLKRITVEKRMRAKLQRGQDRADAATASPDPRPGTLARERRARPLRYYAVPGNGDAIIAFHDQVTRHWHRSLRRRSQRHRHDLEADASPRRSMATTGPASCTPGPTRASTPTPKAGAQCVRRARWDLCGGPPARAVPTAMMGVKRKAAYLPG